MRASRRTKTTITAAMAATTFAMTIPACTTNDSGGREFHPESILAVAGLAAAGMFAPHIYDDSPPGDFDRQWDEIQRATEQAHSRR
jgi:hypothetical protein